MEDPLLFVVGTQNGTPLLSALTPALFFEQKMMLLLYFYFFFKKVINLYLSGQIPNLGMQSKKQNSIPKRKMDESQVHLSVGLRIRGTNFA